MNLDYKKLGVLLLVIIAIIALVFIIYFFFFQPFNDQPKPKPVPQSTSTLPISGTGNQNTSGQSQTDNFDQSSSTSIIQAGTANQSQNIKSTPITKDPVYFATSDSNGLIYYNYSDGKFYRVSPDGQVTTFSDKEFYDVSNVVWSNSKDKAVLQYPDGSNIIYDFKQNKQINLQKHWTDFTFSPSDQQIAFKNMALDPENRYLAIGDSNASNLKIIESIGGVENKFQVNWSPNNAMIANFVDGKNMDRSEIYFVGLNNENYKSMIVEGRGFNGIWTPDGSAMVYSVYKTSDYVPKLWISGAGPDNIGDGRNLLGINTWADKCSFGDKTTLYCAVPQTIPYGAGLERGLMSGISDDIYQIDLQTGAKKMITTDSTMQINKVYPLENNKYILYSATDGKIYRAEL